MPEEEKVSLENLGNGAAVQLFNLELAKVLENITDPNTKPTAARSITLTVKIAPNEDRNYGDVGIACTSKLAPVATYSTHFFIGRHLGKVVAQESNPRQPKLFENQDPGNVTEFPTQEAKNQ